MLLLQMFEIEEIDSSLNIFSEARRPLNICNLNQAQVFKPISTRIPSLQAIREKRKDFSEAILEHPINPPLEEGQTVGAGDKIAVESDHFNRDFDQLSIPSCLLDHVPPIHAGAPQQQVRPHWHCDIPTSAMTLQKKITYHDVCDPKMTHQLPSCSTCGTQLEYPFYASLDTTICPQCYSTGKLPIYTTTKDFYLVDKPYERDESWTLAETNKLLSFIEEYGDDWQTISQEMRTRTPSECLLHFLRLPIIDQYYCDDPIAVEECNDDMSPMLPFMMAPHPIATLVEFVHIFNHKLGSAVAEVSQKIIRDRLNANSSMIPFSQVPEILTLIIQATKEEAGKLCEEESGATLDMLKNLVSKLQFKVQEQFVSIQRQIKQADVRASALGFSISDDAKPANDEAVFTEDLPVLEDEDDSEEEQKE